MLHSLGGEGGVDVVAEGGVVKHVFWVVSLVLLEEAVVLGYSDVEAELGKDGLELSLDPFNSCRNRAQSIANIVQDARRHFRDTREIRLFHQLHLCVLESLAHLVKFISQFSDLIFTRKKRGVLSLSRVFYIDNMLNESDDWIDKDALQQPGEE